ncbi:carboxypeptidase-like regulatory domain-containing protein [Pedobacter sp. R20-19]|uniref:carboxypeptidase-like regulatory domain-containing protein n=1 Tax=Pedobacter sp. R20-19 TaxID=1270196 RepID=UPI0004937092|nr:carboxypeptidase-like regulatory domain-containing protein [Pedobacter sp. R20-19]
MATSFKLIINEPCTAHWAEMKAHQNGKFCIGCQKAVVDFTQFSDAELKNWFVRNQGKGCGRFKPEQLNRLIEKKSNFSVGNFKPGLVAASLIALLSFPKLGNAINTKPFATFQSDSRKSFSKNIECKNVSEDLVTISGTVIDKDEKQPIIGANIRVKGSSISAVTDKDGNFELVLDRNKFKKNVILDLRYIGYEGKNIKINLSKKARIVIGLKMGSYILGGFGVLKQPTFLEKIAQFLNG